MKLIITDTNILNNLLFTKMQELNQPQENNFIKIPFNSHKIYRPNQSNENNFIKIPLDTNDQDDEDFIPDINSLTMKFKSVDIPENLRKAYDILLLKLNISYDNYQDKVHPVFLEDVDRPGVYVVMIIDVKPGYIKPIMWMPQEKDFEQIKDFNIDDKSKKID